MTTMSADHPEHARMCCRCYDEGELLPADCAHQPQDQITLGMHHCPDCGAMLLGGFWHPPLCRPCLTRTHPRFDAPPPERHA